MRQWIKGLAFTGAMLGLATGITVGCRKNATLPIKPQPTGVLKLRFSRTVRGPVDVAVDGVRIPVTVQGKKNFRELTIAGLTAGKHRYYLSSPRDSFGPDQGEVEMPPNQGLMLFLFAQRFDAVLYGTPEPVPVPEGLPGVTAVLSK